VRCETHKKALRARFCRIVDGRITDNWHLKDNLTFLQQLGVVAK